MIYIFLGKCCCGSGSAFTVLSVIAVPDPHLECKLRDPDLAPTKQNLMLTIINVVVFGRGVPYYTGLYISLKKL
jgi:hypothetical protein